MLIILDILEAHLDSLEHAPLYACAAAQRAPQEDMAGRASQPAGEGVGQEPVSYDAKLSWSTK